MAKHDELIIEPRNSGQWAVKKPHAERASVLVNTYLKAAKWAKEHAPEGDIKVKGSNGRFRYL